MISKHKNSLNNQQHDIRADGSCVTLTAVFCASPTSGMFEFNASVTFEKNSMIYYQLIEIKFKNRLGINSPAVQSDSTLC